MGASCAPTSASPEATYRWTAPTSGLAVASTCGSGLDTVLFVTEGDCLTSASQYAELACNDNGCATGNGSRVQFYAKQGQTYNIVVDGKDVGGVSTAGSYLLTVAPPPPETSCGQVTAIPALGGSDSSVTSGLGSEAAASGAGGLSGERVYSWVPLSAGAATISTCGSTLDTLLYVRQGNCASGTQVAFNDNGCPSGGGSSLTLSVEVGTPYYIVVDGATPGATGAFSLTVTPPPHSCNYPLAIDPWGGTYTGAIVPADANDTGSVTCSYYQQVGKEVVYKWTPATSGSANISTCQTNAMPTSMALFVRPDNCYDNVGQNDDCRLAPYGCGPGQNGARLANKQVEAGHTYFIIVDSTELASFEYTLEVSIAAP